MELTGAEFALIIGAFISGAAALITAMATNKSAASKSQLEILSGTIAIVQSENKRLLARVEHLEQELEERDGTLAQVQEWAELLVAQVRSYGGTPVAMPERDPTRPRKPKAVPQ